MSDVLFYELTHSAKVEAPNAEDRMVDADRIVALRNCIEALPADQRAVPILREFEEISCKQIAEAASLPVGTGNVETGGRPAALGGVRRHAAEGSGKMNCTSSRELLGAYLDEELDVGLQAEVQGHLAGCNGCSGAYARLRDNRSISGRMRRVLKRRRCGWKQCVQRGEPRLRMKPATSRTNRSLGWVAIAASILLCISVAWNLVLLPSRPEEPDFLAENLLSSHVRSLIGTHLVG
jgi:hypothetical protein